jgi:hypothetical protein
MIFITTFNSYKVPVLEIKNLTHHFFGAKKGDKEVIA